MTELIKPLSNCRKRRMVKSRFRDVIKTNDCQILRNPFSQTSCRSHQPECNLIVTGKNSIHFWKFRDQFMQAAFTAFRRPVTLYQLRILDRYAGVCESFLPAQPRRRSLAAHQLKGPEI